MQPENDHFRWGKELIACFDDLRPTFAGRTPPIVDREIMPHFDGRPDDMFIWFICAWAGGRMERELELTRLVKGRCHG